MFDDTEHKLRQDFEICEFLSLQLNKSPDACDISQLLVFNRMVFNNGNNMEKLLHCYMGRREVKTFQSSGLLETTVPIHKLVSVTINVLQTRLAKLGFVREISLP
jgi:hypothetical protein